MPMRLLEWLLQSTSLEVTVTSPKEYEVDPPTSFLAKTNRI